MRLIVAEVVLEWPAPDYPKDGFGLAMPKPEGTTWYPDGRVFVRTEEDTPKWLGYKRERRRRRAREAR